MKKTILIAAAALLMINGIVSLFNLWRPVPIQNLETTGYAIGMYFGISARITLGIAALSILLTMQKKKVVPRID